MVQSIDAPSPQLDNGIPPSEDGRGPGDGGKRGRAEKDLTTGPITSTLLLFALPVLGSNLLQSINGSINAVWVGRLLGEQALAATSNANLVMFLVLGVVFGVGMAATILVAQAAGRHDLAEARRVVGTGTTSFIVLAVCFALAGGYWTDDILALLGTPPDALPLATAYLRVIFIAMPAMNLLGYLMAILRGAGDSRTPFAFMALSVALDVALNPLLIKGYGPFPELGIAGSAWATLIGQVVSVIALVVVVYRRKDPLRLTGADLTLLRPDLSLVKVLVFRGVPIGMQILVISVAALTIMSLVNQAGSQVTAAYGIAAQLWTYVQMPALAVGAAVSSMAAQNVGAGKWDRVAGITGAGIGINLVLTTTLVIALYLFERPVLGLFLGTDGTAIDLAIRINRFVVWSFILFGITIVLFGTVRSTGAVLPPLLILAASLLVVRTLFAYSLRGTLGLDALWISFSVGSVVSVLLASLYYRYGRWRQVRIGGRPPAGSPLAERTPRSSSGPVSTGAATAATVAGSAAKAATAATAATVATAATAATLGTAEPRPLSPAAALQAADVVAAAPILAADNGDESDPGSTAADPGPDGRVAAPVRGAVAVVVSFNCRWGVAADTGLGYPCEEVGKRHPS